MECPKDEIIIHSTSGVGYRVISRLQRSQKITTKITQNWLKYFIFGDFSVMFGIFVAQIDSRGPTDCHIKNWYV